jgi:hypothetical protein
MSGMEEGTGFTAQHIMLAIALAAAGEDYGRAKQEAEEVIAFESSATAHPRRLTMMILSAALCESTINTYLALRCDPACWASLERANPVEKWSKAPKEFIPQYTFPFGSDLDKDLRFLFECRNSIMHARPRVTIGESVRHEGTAEAWEKIDEAALRRVWDLPLRLLQHLEQFDHWGAVVHFSSLSPYLTPQRFFRSIQSHQ